MPERCSSLSGRAKHANEEEPTRFEGEEDQKCQLNAQRCPPGDTTQVSVIGDVLGDWAVGLLVR